MSKLNWKMGLGYLVIPTMASLSVWGYITISKYGEYIDPFIHPVDSFVILFPGTIVSFIGVIGLVYDKKITHLIAIFFALLLIAGSVRPVALLVVNQTAEQAARSYICPVTWEGPKATLACEYGKVEQTVSTIPLAYHMLPLPNKGTCKYKKYATGKFEDCKIF